MKSPQQLHGTKPNECLVYSVIKMGHHSVLEHVNITFAIDKISRAAANQLTRHRIGVSYSQASQRFIKYDKIDYIIPPSINADEEKCHEFQIFMKDISNYYGNLIKSGIKSEDARAILPNATATNLTMTVNARELIEMCKLRLCMTAQEEIRKLFESIKLCINNNKELKFLSSYLLPKCVWLKYCPEGIKSCNKKAKFNENNE